MSDLNLPTVNSLKANFPAEIRANDDSLVKMLDGTSDTNLPTGAKRLNGTTNRFEQWDGSSWDALDLKSVLTSLGQDLNFDSFKGVGLPAATGNGEIVRFDEFNAHESDIDNPHLVDALDVGAVDIDGDTMSGPLALAFANANLIIDATNVGTPKLSFNKGGQGEKATIRAELDDDYLTITSTDATIGLQGEGKQAVNWAPGTASNHLVTKGQLNSAFFVGESIVVLPNGNSAQIGSLVSTDTYVFSLLPSVSITQGEWVFTIGVQILYRDSTGTLANDLAIDTVNPGNTVQYQVNIINLYHQEQDSGGIAEGRVVFQSRTFRQAFASTQTGLAIRTRLNVVGNQTPPDIIRLIGVSVLATKVL